MKVCFYEVRSPAENHKHYFITDLEHMKFDIVGLKYIGKKNTYPTYYARWVNLTMI